MGKLREHILQPYYLDKELTKEQLHFVREAMDKYGKAIALAFYEHEESVPPEEMESTYDLFWEETQRLPPNHPATFGPDGYVLDKYNPGK